MNFGHASGLMEICDAISTEYHDVLCSLGRYVWQDISLPCQNGSVLRIPCDDEPGDILRYDGVSVIEIEDRMAVVYCIDGFMAAFPTFEMECEPFSVGSGCISSISVSEAERIVSAVEMTWIDSPDGFVKVDAEGIDGEDDMDYFRRDAGCGLSICTDCSESWVEVSDCSETSGIFDISSASILGDVLRIDTDRCVFLIPIEGAVQ